MVGGLRRSGAKLPSVLPINLTTEYERDPLGLGVTMPRFSWQLESVDPGVVQYAYEIEVKTGDEIVWRSGKVEGPAQVLIPYAGQPLRSRQRCSWRVRVWDGDSEPGAWSESGTFETGLLEVSDWDGSAWIGPLENPQRDAKRPSPILRREFDVGDAGEARLYISALGLYDVQINGVRVSEDWFRPGFTAYEHRIQYQAYDVTALLNPGRNSIGITLGDGWWRGRVGVSRKPNNWGKHVAAIARIEIGGEPVASTDSSWTCSEGGIRAGCLFHGEIYDARLEPDRWNQVGFADNGWSRVRTFDGPTERLCAQVGPSVRVIDCVPAQRIFTTPSGETVVDFGQNLAGVVHFSVKGPRGARVQLTHGETLTAHGEFTADTFGHSRQQISYTLAGRPEPEEHAARFTYHGFRYARVDEWPGPTPPTVDNFTALVLSSDSSRVGRFECSHQGLNQLAENIDRSQLANFVDIPTDCPTREKAGWTGDIAVFARTGALNRHIAPVLTRWLGDVREDQLPDGRIPCVVPVSKSYNSFYMRATHGAAAWADACVLVPWTMYQFYGDRRILEDNYITMSRWVACLEQRARRKPWWAACNPLPRRGWQHQHIIEQGFQWAEWLAPGETLTKNWLRGLLRPDPLIATAYYVNTLAIVADIAALLDHDHAAEQLAEQHHLVVQAARDHLFEADGLPKRRDQIGLVASLAFGLVAQPHRAAAGEALAAAVRANNSRLATGFTMTPLLCPTLVDTGNTELAYDVLLNEEIPSWLYPISKGATTIWETWDAVAPDGSVSDVSQNHYAFGAIGEFLHRYVVGVDTDLERPGYEHIRIRPVPDPARRISGARADLETARGLVSVRWEQHDKQMVVDATIPVGSTATISVGSTETEVGPGTHQIIAE
ncbi:MAG: Bacterial alpha-L-rhamnosidase [Acidimicrobiaceae bacterium]|nr:Bacterial alpha-L-rhamnosidase [Acidimicrobiaceae bacterium]MYG55245.1 Bacterial alpha-L-rhamnosidase [Acidimicrobiaceae bacterium]MYJ99679.1 Bacterial alpha-L-rhamnosidase [Acidimicrobiaceae bacterium]